MPIKTQPADSSILEDENESRYFQSKEFKDNIAKAIEADTWGKGRPMIYMDEEGWLVEHWEDGRIIRKKKIKDMSEVKTHQIRTLKNKV